MRGNPQLVGAVFAHQMGVPEQVRGSGVPQWGIWSSLRQTARSAYTCVLKVDAVIVELKAVHQLAQEHEAQLLNYLKATPYEVGLLLNFGPKPEIKRKAFDNSRKGTLEWIEDADRRR